MFPFVNIEMYIKILTHIHVYRRFFLLEETHSLDVVYVKFYLIR